MSKWADPKLTAEQLGLPRHWLRDALRSINWPCMILNPGDLDLSLSSPNCKCAAPVSPAQKPGAPITPETLAVINAKRAERQELIDEHFLLTNHLDTLRGLNRKVSMRIEKLTDEIRNLAEPERSEGMPF